MSYCSWLKVEGQCKLCKHSLTQPATYAMWTLYKAKCTMYTVYNVHWLLYSAVYIIQSEQYKTIRVHCTVCTIYSDNTYMVAQCTLYSVDCTMYIVQCIQYKIVSLSILYWLMLKQLPLTTTTTTTVMI